MFLVQVLWINCLIGTHYQSSSSSLSSFFAFFIGGSLLTTFDDDDDADADADELDPTLYA